MECFNRTSKAIFKDRVASLLEGAELNYIGIRACIEEMVELDSWKEEVGGKDCNILQSTTRN